MGVHVDGEGEGGHRPVGDLFSPACRGRVEGHHGERDDVEACSARTVEGS